MFDTLGNSLQNANFIGCLFCNSWRKKVQKLFPSMTRAFNFNSITLVLHTVLESVGFHKTTPTPLKIRIPSNFLNFSLLSADHIIFNNFLMYNSVNKGERHEH